jgi:hypothetical protein
MSYEELPPEGTTYQTPNSSMAIISLIAGILGFTFFPLMGSIVAVITGYMARKEIQESAGTIGGEGLATAGLVMGWIGIGLTAIGLCIAGFFIGISFCFVPLGIWMENSYLIFALFV